MQSCSSQGVPVWASVKEIPTVVVSGQTEETRRAVVHNVKGDH